MERVTLFRRTRPRYTLSAHISKSLLAGSGRFSQITSHMYSSTNIFMQAASCYTTKIQHVCLCGTDVTLCLHSAYSCSTAGHACQVRSILSTTLPHRAIAVSHKDPVQKTLLSMCLHCIGGTLERSPSIPHVCAAREKL